MLMRAPEYLNENYRNIKQKIDNDYSANQSVWQIFWTEASLDSRLEAGDTSLMAEINTQLPNNNRGSWYFNRVRPICNMISGHQRRNRKSSIVVPMENGDQHTADQWTKILLNIYKREGVYETISEAFHQGACIAGLNLLHVYMDYQFDPVNGDIKIDNCPYNSFLIDPYFRKPDLSDASFVWRRSYLSHSEAAALMPKEYYDEIMALPGNPTGIGRDGRFQYMPESYGQTIKNKLSYDEYYYRDYRKQKRLIDKITGDVFEVSNSSQVDIDSFLDAYPQIEYEEAMVPTVRLAIMIQDKVFYDGPQPLAIDVYPFVPVMGYYNPMMPYFYSRIQGVCRSLRDPQILLNRRIILSADLLESQLNSGWIFKENSIVDVKHLFQTGQGRVIPLKQESQMTDLQPIQPPQIPPSFFQLQETFSSEMNLVSGVNEELLGAAIDDKAGILSALRQSAGLTTLQPLFDKLDYAQNLLGELIMKVIRSNYTPGKIKSLLEGEEPAPLFYNKAFGKYHCQVQLGMNTESQKQMQFAQLLHLKEMGVPIPDSALLDAATVQNKDKILKEIQAQQQKMNQVEQAQSQMAMQNQQAQIELARAKALSDTGLGYERLSRIQENQALAKERQAEAVKDDQLALLNFAKAIRELQNIDLSQLQKIISLQQLLQSLESENNPQAFQSVSGSLDRG